MSISKRIKRLSLFYIVLLFAKIQNKLFSHSYYLEGMNILKINIIKPFVVLICTLTLFGCGSSKVMKSFESDYECLSAARALGEQKAEDNIIKSMSNKPYLSNLSPQEEREIMIINKEINDYYSELEYLNNYKSIFYPVKMFNSKECLSMSEQKKVNISDMGDIGLTTMYYIFYVFL